MITAEIPGVWTFLSAADRVSGMEALSTVRDLGEINTKPQLAWLKNGRNWMHCRPLAGRMSISLLKPTSPSSSRVKFSYFSRISVTRQ